MTETAVKSTKKKSTASKKKRKSFSRAKSRLLTDMIDAESVEIHKMIKKKNPSYPSLPKFLLNAKHKVKVYKDKGLQESVLRGFYKRVSNWHKTNSLVFSSTEGE